MCIAALGDMVHNNFDQTSHSRVYAVAQYTLPCSGVYGMFATVTYTNKVRGSKFLNPAVVVRAGAWETQTRPREVALS
jgi:hypothetical protein